MYTAAQLAQLRAFIDANAGTYGALSDEQVADTMNAATETRVKASLSGSEVFSSTVASEFDALTDAQRSEWLSLCAIETLNPADGTPARDTAVRIFGGGSGTIAALQTLRTESVSPAQLEGLPKVRADYVRVARAL